MTLDRKNFLVGCACALLAFVAAITAGAVANESADEVRVERQRTLQAMVDGCMTIEHEEMRGLCIAAVGERR